MNLFVFGLGYCACDFISRHGARFATVSGTIRDAEKTRALGKGSEITRFLFDKESEKPAIIAALDKADVLLISVPPGLSIDPVLAKFGRHIAGLKQKLKVIYLSTVGVYGDRKGEWVDEERVPKPQSGRSMARLHAEKAWMSLSRDPRKEVQILRLAGIYGPGRNALEALRSGTAHRIIKQDQVFNRIHVKDISAAIDAAIDYDKGSEIWNVSDDEPAPPQDVVAYAASLMGIEPPPEMPIEKASLTPMQRSFYAENRRAANQKLKEKLGVTLAYPTYREGLTALWKAGEGRA